MMTNVPRWLDASRGGWHRGLPLIRQAILHALEYASSPAFPGEPYARRYAAARAFLNEYLNDLHNAEVFEPGEPQARPWWSILANADPARRFAVALSLIRYSNALGALRGNEAYRSADVAIRVHSDFPRQLVDHILEQPCRATDQELAEFIGQIEALEGTQPNSSTLEAFLGFLEGNYDQSTLGRASAAAIEALARRWSEGAEDWRWLPAVRLRRLLGLGDPPDRDDSSYPFAFAFEHLNKLAGELDRIESPLIELKSTDSGREILALSLERRNVVARCASAAADTDRSEDVPTFCPPDLRRHRRLPKAGAIALQALLRAAPAVPDADLLDILSRMIVRRAVHHRRTGADYLTAVTKLLQRRAKHGPLNPGIENQIERIVFGLRRSGAPPERRTSGCLRALLPDSKQFPLEAEEPWAEQALADIARAEATRRASHKLLAHCHASISSTPSAKWLKAAEELLGAVGPDSFRARLPEWFSLVDRPRTLPLETGWGPVDPLTPAEANASVLKGLAWCCGLVQDAQLASALGTLAVSAYRKIPGIGPRMVKVGNACIWALGNMPGMDGVSQLALLNVRVKFGTARKLIDKALATAGQRLGIPREDIEELAVPAYGLSDVGLRRETLGDHTVELAVTGTDSTELRIQRPDGKPLKAPPAKIKEQFADELAELKQAARDIQKMLPAQRERIDQLFLQQKSWELDVWKQRYLDHPLVGVIARRLIWRFAHGKKTTDAMFHDGRLVDVRGRPFDPAPQARVELWHPIGRSTDEITAWRRFLDERGIGQPFKQAHREIYLLTDAERNTRVYSNRFAAHVLRQHQFNALCAARGWKNKLRLMVDDEFPPATRALPHWNLRAEFWIEGIGDDYGTDTNETGVFYRVSTDQVRFYTLAAPSRTAHAGGGGYYTHGEEGSDNPLELSQVPPLVFSEIMRDVDLFVGVASVGNDPRWSDGGPEGRYRDYWFGYSFGELGESAKTRKAVLERLIPRLRIAERCKLTERFLVVRGDLRSYKIHLGSGNILMEPNDQYLCIVPSRSQTAPDKVMLPFEGDQTLAVILSKALLLADDTKIKDPTITAQIGRSG